ncbi:MAG: TetR/AcrR family transcriptional regulator [Oceanicaulis sp.]
MQSRITRRDLQREATKAAVLDAARKVFLSEGFDGATIKAIADEANVSPGTVLNAEPSKAALLVAILREESRTMAETCEQMEGALSGAASERLSTLLHIVLDHHVRHGELYAAAIGHSWLTGDGDYHAAFEALDFAWGSIKRVLEDGRQAGEFRSDLDGNAAFTVICDAVYGALRSARRHDGPDASDTLTKRLSIIIAGLKA